ncbi:hypothetical protein KSP39_PZI011313 [Platanthera zijinensis]|uniref:Uncharacterized protein n=1 Tax=Platanthera zijinensis TaxID=2320716 RepID=A0AAP0BIN2_9ASPA
MTLLDSITRAAAAADDSLLSAAAPNTLIILNPNGIFPNLKPDRESLTSGQPLLRVSGWSISPTDSDIIRCTSKFSKSIRKKLKKHKTLNHAGFLQLLNTFLGTVGEKLGVPLDSEASSHPNSTSFARSSIKKLRCFIGGEVAGLLSKACVVLELWELLETIIVSELVGPFYSTNLVEKLVDQNRAKLLCLCVKHIADLRPAEILAVLRFFLSPPSDAYNGILEVKKEWEKQAMLAIEKATKNGVPKHAAILAKEASILLMLAHDSFSASESCLHYVFGTSNIDGLVLSSVFSSLNGREVLALIRYLVRWLKKYERFPEAGPCLQANSVLSLSVCDVVPSFESIVGALSLVLDEHFSYLVLNTEFYNELKDAQEVVNDLAAEADASSPLDCLVNHLKYQFSKNESQ